MRRSDQIKSVGIFLLSFFLPVVFFAPFKPIWIDEFLQFVMGAYSSVTEAWSVFIASMKINHGQTGAYFISNYFLLKNFGASLWILRLPSLVAGVYTYILALIFMRLVRISSIGQVLGLFLIALTPWLTYLFSEARPYAMVAMSAVASLVYFFSWIENPNHFKRYRLIAFPALVLGSLFHPYFILYFFALGLFGVLSVFLMRWKFLTVSELKSYIGMKSFLFLLLVFFTIASFTWIAHPAGKFGFNPYEFLRAGVSPLRAVFSAQLEMLERFWILKPLVSLALGFGLIRSLYVLMFKRANLPKWSQGVLLFWLAILLTGVVSWVSIRQEYWVLPRQWAGSYVLISIALVWSFDCLVQQMKSARLRTVCSGFVVIVFSMLIVNQWFEHKRNSQNDYEQYVQSQILATARKEKISSSEKIKGLNDHEWMELANSNVAQGGNVWMEFKEYYPNRIAY